MSNDALPLPGSLLQIHGLSSEGGKPLNGRLAMVLSHEADTKTAAFRLRIFVLPTKQAPGTIRRVLSKNAKFTPQPLPGSPEFQTYVTALLQEAEHSREDPKRARLLYEQLLTLEGYEPSIAIRANYAGLLRLLRDFDRAAEVLETLVEVATGRDVHYLWQDLAAAYLGGGHFEKAYQVAMKIEDSELRLEILKELIGPMNGKRLEKAVCEEVVKINANHGLACWRLGTLFCKEGKMKEGVEWLKQALEGQGLSEGQRERVRRELEEAEIE